MAVKLLCDLRDDAQFHRSPSRHESTKKRKQKKKKGKDSQKSNDMKVE